MERAWCRVPILLIGALAFCVATLLALGAEANSADDPDALVLRLRELPEHLDAGPFSVICSGSRPCPPPPLPPLEAERRRIYNELYALGPAGVAALARSLASSDVQLRRNVAVTLDVLGGGWWFHDRYPSRIDISAALPALMTALGDSDKDVRAYAASDLGDVGSKAAPAVRRLIELLGDPNEGVRNNVCIGLKGIGPAAKAALPALRQALADPSEDVRRFARLAIASIEGRLRAAG
jgi:HEAT repeats